MMNVTDFTAYGVSVIPFALTKKGDKLQKKPLVDSWSKWITSPQTEEDVDSLAWGDADGVGLLTGGTGEVFCFDIDAKDTTDREEILSEITGYLDSLESSYYVESTPSGGYHILVRCKTTEPNTKLIPDKLETRGHGGLVVVAPSRGYAQVGALDICSFLDSDERLAEEDLKKMLAYFKQQKDVDPSIFSTVENQNSLTISEVETLELLKDNGWKIAFEKSSVFGITYYLTRPDKDSGVSATFNHKGSKCLYLFSSSVEGLKLGYNNAIDILTKYKFNGDRIAANNYAVGNTDKEENDLTDIFNASEKTGKFTINRVGLSRWFGKQGFYKVHPFENEHVKSVVIEGTFVREIKAEDLSEAFIQAVRDSGITQYEEAALAFCMGRSAQNLLLLLETVEIEFLQDNKRTCYLPFRNCCVVIRDYEIKCVEYSDLGYAVWRDSVIQHDIKIDKGESATRNFIRNICTNRVAGSVEQLDSKLHQLVRESVGYLIHGYKDEAHAKAVVLMEDVISGRYESQGGRGKSLLLKLVSSLAPSVALDARGTNFSNMFAFSSYKEGKRLFILQDVTSDFNTETIFPRITDDWAVNRKYQQEYSVPFKYSPKLAITSNYSLVRKGDSNDRRFIEVSIKNYYTKSHTPIDDKSVGYLLNPEWSQEEWDRHYYSLFECVSVFLSKGKVTLYISETARARKIQTSIPEKFYPVIVQVFDDMAEGGFYTINQLQTFCRMQDDSFHCTGSKIISYLTEYATLTGEFLIIETKGTADATDRRYRGVRKIKTGSADDYRR